MKKIAYIILIATVLGSSFECKKDDNPVVPPPAGLADPSFRIISPGWLNQVFKQWMNDIWHNSGIGAKGMNYFFFPLPAPSHTYSERFNPQSRYFQCWFGAYTVEDSNNATYGLSGDSIDASAIVQLSLADQKAWLQSFAGLSQPSAVIDTTVPVQVAAASVDGRSGWKITARLNSNADVGANNPQSNYPSILLIPSSAWQGLVASYTPVKLEVVSYVWYAPENRELNIVYYNGVMFDDSLGVHHRTLPQLSSELDSMALAVTVHG